MELMYKGFTKQPALQVKELKAVAVVVVNYLFFHQKCQSKVNLSVNSVYNTSVTGKNFSTTSMLYTLKNLGTHAPGAK